MTGSDCFGWFRLVVLFSVGLVGSSCLCLLGQSFFRWSRMFAGVLIVSDWSGPRPSACGGEIAIVGMRLLALVQTDPYE